MYYSFTRSERLIRKRYEEELHQPIRWNESSLASFSELNDKILKMQDFVYRKMLAVNQEFLKLQEEFTFLKGFQVIGQIGFEKNLLKAVQDEKAMKRLSKEEKKNYILWTMLTDFTDSRVWQLTYDSSVQDFTPYSKDLLKEIPNSRLTKFPKDCGIHLASYFNSLVRMNHSITLKDLQNCTIEDFYPFVFVTVNFDEPEIVGFRNYRSTLPEDIEAMLSERKRLHDYNFIWSEENKKKILDVNEFINKKTDFMQNSMTKLQSKFKELGKNNNLFEHFEIDAEIQYQNKNHSTDIADKKLLRILQDNTNFSAYNMHCTEDTKKVIDPWNDNETEEWINWNFEVFKEHLTEEQQKIPFSYFMHAIFVDGCTYSMEDLIRMKEEDFIVCWDINVNNDEEGNI